LGNLQTSYTKKKMTKYTELSTGVKQQWQVEVVFTVSVAGVISLTPHVVLK